MRKRIAWQLRCLADRIDPKSATRGIGWSFTFERGVGLVFHNDRNAGCSLWYLGEDEWKKAYSMSQTLQLQADGTYW